MRVQSSHLLNQKRVCCGLKESANAEQMGELLLTVAAFMTLALVQAHVALLHSPPLEPGGPSQSSLSWTWTGMFNSGTRHIMTDDLRLSGQAQSS